jgi:hypothetical protein
LVKRSYSGQVAIARTTAQASAPKKPLSTQNASPTMAKSTTVVTMR